MTKNLIDKKYYVLIWVALAIAALISNIYTIYLSFEDFASFTRSDILLLIFEIITSACFSAALCFLLAFLAYIIGAKSYANAIPRNDFIYSIMLATACVKLLVGIIDAFAIIEPKIFVINSNIIEFVLNTTCYLLLFFLIFKKKYDLNPNEKYNAFRIFATFYLILEGVLSMWVNVLYFYLLAVGQGTPNLISDLALELDGIILFADEPLQTVVSSIALGLYLAVIIGAIISGEIMKKTALRYQSPKTRGEYFDSHPNNPYEMRDDVHDTYGEFGEDKKEDDSKDDKVFDEFDI